MAKAKSLVNVTFGATGDVYEKGKTYDVPAELLKKYPDYLHYYTISRRQGQKRKVTKHIIDINKEVQKCVKIK